MRLKSTYADLQSGGIRTLAERSGRAGLGLQAVRLTRESPLAGWGPGGYLRNLQNVRYRNAQNPGWVDNANNHYLQQSADIGLIGTAFNVLLHVIPLWMTIRIWSRVDEPRERWPVAIAFTLVSVLLVLYITGPHSMALGVLWLLCVMLAFLVTTALRYGYRPVKITSTLVIPLVTVWTLFFIAATYSVTFGTNGYKTMHEAPWWPLRFGRNCYGEEKWGNKHAHWCNGNAMLSIPLVGEQPQILALELVASNSDIRAYPLRVSYGGKSGPIHTLTIHDSAPVVLSLPVTPEDIDEVLLPGGSRRRYLVLSLDVSRTWIPKDWGVNADTRQLGVAVVWAMQ